MLAVLDKMYAKFAQKGIGSIVLLLLTMISALHALIHA